MSVTITDVQGVADFLDWSGTSVINLSILLFNIYPDKHDKMYA